AASRVSIAAVMADLSALWITSHYPNPANRAGGTYLMTQARALVRASVAVTVVTPTPFAPASLARLSSKWRAYRDTPKCQTDDGVEVKFPRYLAVPNQSYSASPHL